MWRAVGMLTCLVIAGCLSSTGGGSDGHAGLVLSGGLVWSRGMDAPAAMDVAIRGQRIIAVGDVADTIGPETRVVGLDGALVLPGLRDAHMHPLRDRPLQPHLTSATEQEQLEADIHNHADQVAFHGQRRALHEAGDLEPDSEAEYGHCTPPDASRIEAVRAQYKAFEDEAAAQGITTLVNAGMSDLTEMAALKRMEAEGEAKLRWLVRVRSGCHEHLDAMGIRPHEGDWTQWHGVKLYGDGYLGAWVAGLQEPYSDRPAWSGILAYTPNALDHYVAAARERGLHVGTHAIGDATIHQVLDAYERAGVTPRDRWTVEHVQVTDPDIIERFARLGVVASIQLSFATTDIRMAGDRLGDRLPDAYDWRGLAEAGVVLAGGTDYPIEVITPLWGVQREVTRQEVDGTPAQPWFPGNGLDLRQSLEAITYGAAYAAGEEHERGAVTAGRIADITVVREDLFGIPADRIAAGTVLMTIVNGQVAFEGERSYPPPS